MLRNLTLLLAVALLLTAFIGCSDDATSPENTAATQSGIFGGEIGDADFEITLRTGIGPDYPLQGPFVLRGYNVRYDEALGATLCELTVTNKGEVPHSEPVGMTFIALFPENVEILNPDNDENGPGASIEYKFLNDDGMWTPGEQSLPRTVQFKAPPGVSIAFLARLDISMSPPGGSIGGVVWHDKDEDGMMDPDEEGLGGVKILLEANADDDSMDTTASSVRVDQTMTADDGSYRFDGLDAGFYTVGKALDQRFRTTTFNPIHVVLVEDTNGVSSFLTANFGCVPVDERPKPELSEGDYVSANGKYNGDDGYLVAWGIDFRECERDTSGDDSVMIDQTSDGDGDDDDDDWHDGWDDWDVCDTDHGKIRGPVTAVDTAHVEIMGTKLSVMLWKDNSSRALSLDDIKVGDRVDARVIYTDDGWKAVRLREWRGNKDQVHGFVEEMLDGDMIKFRVFDTKVIYDPKEDDDDDDHHGDGHGDGM